MARFGIMTINQHELWSIQKIFSSKSDFSQIRALSHSSIFNSSVEIWRWKEHEIVLVNNFLSGNIVASAIAHEEFIPELKGPFNYWILFGCAGVVPNPKVPQVVKVQNSKSSQEAEPGERALSDVWPSKGQVVVVKGAFYLENGMVEHLKSNQPQENVLLKSDRIRNHLFYPNWGVWQLFATNNNLLQVEVACSEKLVKLDLTSKAPISSLGEISYSSAIKMTKAQIIDMESFGFFVAFGKEKSCDTIIIRVITDELTDHGSTTGLNLDESGIVQLVPQQHEDLERGAGQVIDFLEFYVSVTKEPNSGYASKNLVQIPVDSMSGYQVDTFDKAFSRTLFDLEYLEGSEKSQLRTLSSNLLKNLLFEKFNANGNEIPNAPEDYLTQYLVSSLSIYIERGYGSLMSADLVSRILKMDKLVRRFSILSDGYFRDAGYYNFEGTLGAFEIFPILVRKLNPKLNPKASLVSAFDHFFGREERLNDFSFDFQRKSSAVLISRGHLAEVLVYVGVDLDQPINHEKSIVEPMRIRWDGFDNDRELVTALQSTFNLPLVRKVRD